MRIPQICALAMALGAGPALAQVCGDGVVTPPEVCDDGNLAPGDGCSPACLPENLPPDCLDAAASVTDVWPPNHKLVPVTVDGVLDPEGDLVAIVITDVAQDEPVDDATCADAFGVGTDTVELRSEREGSGDGRVYHVTFTATDPFGASCAGEVAVCVRHDNGNGSACGDGGPLFDSWSADSACSDDPVCDIDACLPDDDPVCDDDLPRAVHRKLARARVVLARAAGAAAPARRARLGRRTMHLLARAKARAGRVLDPVCGDVVIGTCRAASDCVACATQSP
jgi:cysteine-rich repeat protein